MLDTFAQELDQLRQQLRVLEDRVEIGDLFARYAQALDEKDWAALETVFADLVDTNFLGRDASRAEIVAFVRKFIEPLFGTHHHLANLRVSLDGDRAQASVHVRAYHAGAGNLKDLYEESLATFEADLVRGPDGWRFSAFDERILILLGRLEVFGFPHEESKSILVDGGHPAVHDPAFGTRGILRDGEGM